MKSNIRKIILAAVFLTVVIIGYILIKSAEKIVDNSYNSGEIVLQNVPEATPTPSYFEEGKVKYDDSTRVEGGTAVSPKEIYSEEGSVRRSQEFLGADYEKYKDIFEEIELHYSDYYDGVDRSYVPTLQEEDYIVNENVNYGFWYDDKVSLLDDFELSIFNEEYDGIEAVYFFGGTYVVYRVVGKGNALIVVDYSTKDVDMSDDLVEFGEIFRSVYLYKDNTNRVEIGNFVVYFTVA